MDQVKMEKMIADHDIEFAEIIHKKLLQGFGSFEDSYGIIVGDVRDIINDTFDEIYKKLAN